MSERDIQIRPTLAQTILGLKPSGVEELGDRLIDAGLLKYLETSLSPSTVQGDPELKPMSGRLI